MIFVLEGVDGSGKTTIAQALQSRLPLSTLIKLSGSPKSNESPHYMEELHYRLYPFLEFVSREQHIICDRFTTSERAYSKLYKSYYPDYLNEYEKFLDSKLEIVQFYLYLPPEKILERMEKKQKETPNEKQPNFESIKAIHDSYNDTMENETKFTTVYLNGDNSVEDIVDEILRMAALITGKSLVSRVETAYSDCVKDQDEHQPVWERLGITKDQYWQTVQELGNGSREPEEYLGE